MIILYCSFSALMSGNPPLPALQSHLPSRYLGSGALNYLKGAVWSWDLDLVTSQEGMICSSRSGRGAADLTTSGLKSGRSLGDLGFCGPVRCLVRFHIIVCLPCSRSSTIQQLPPSLVVASSGYETLVLLILATCLSFLVAVRL